MEYPPLALGKSRFDQTVFAGRLRHILDITDPRCLFTSKKRLKECISLLDTFKNNQLPAGITDKDLWETQKVKQIWSTGYVPFGTVTVFGMLLPNPMFGQMIFWQWMNLSHNACINYANRNATKVGLSILIKKAKIFSPATKSLIQRFVPYPAVGSGNNSWDPSNITNTNLDNSTNHNGIA